MKLSDADLLALGFDRRAFMETPLSSSFDYDEPTWVYVMHSGGYHKVGVASDIRKRLAAVILHNPHSVTVAHSIRFQSRLQALLVERTTHRALAPHHVTGEWFSADFATVKRILLPIAAAARVLRERHMLELKHQRLAWERENPHWPEMGEDSMRIQANIHGKHETA